LRSRRPPVQEYLHATQVHSRKRRRVTLGEGHAEPQLFCVEFGGSKDITDRQRRVMLFALDPGHAKHIHSPGVSRPPTILIRSAGEIERQLHLPLYVINAARSLRDSPAWPDNDHRMTLESGSDMMHRSVPQVMPRAYFYVVRLWR